MVVCRGHNASKMVVEPTNWGVFQGRYLSKHGRISPATMPVNMEARERPRRMISTIRSSQRELQAFVAWEVIQSANTSTRVQDRCEMSLLGNTYWSCQK